MDLIKRCSKLPLLVLVLMGPFVSWGQCTFDFVASETNICENDKVNFEITNLPASYKSISWKLGAKNAQGELNPSAVYVNSGNYDVVLTIDDGTKTCTVKKDDYIKVKTAPDIGKVTASKSEACATGESVSFVNSSKDAVDWQWSVEGRSYSGSNNITHWFNFEGRPIIQLTVENDFGCRTSKIYDSLVHVLERPDIKFDSLSLRACEVPGNIAPTPVYDLKGASIAQYIWTFDGATIRSGLGKIPGKRTYKIPGRYDVDLTLRTKGGCSFKYQYKKIVRIADIPALELKATPIAKAGCNSMRYRIRATGGGDPSKFEWSVDPSAVEWSDFSIKNDIKILFNRPGKHTVRCTVKRHNCENVYSVVVNAQPSGATARFTAPDCICQVPGWLTIENQSKSEKPLTYLWTVYLDEDVVYTSSDKKLNYRVEEEGLLQVVLRATAPDGCWDEHEEYIQAGNIDLTVHSFPTSGCKGKKAVVAVANACSVQERDIDIYFFNEKNELTYKTHGFEPIMNFGPPGLYSVAISIKNKQGCTDSIYLKKHFRLLDCLKDSIFIVAVEAQKSYCAGYVTVALDPDSLFPENVKITTYLVYADDTLHKVKGVYNKSDQQLVFGAKRPGWYHLVLVASLEGTNLTKRIVLENRVVVTEFTVDVSVGEAKGCFPNKEVILSAGKITRNYFGLNEDTTVYFQWLAYPKKSTVIWSPLKRETKLTILENVGAQIELNVKDVLGCTAVWQSKGNVVDDFKAKFDPPDSLCFGDSIPLNNGSLGDIASFEWTSTTSSDVFEPSASSQYPELKVSEEGKRVVRLRVYDDNGCVDSFKVALRLIDMNVDFEVTDTTAKCSPAIYTFISNSDKAQRYVWNFGDGDIVKTKQQQLNKIYDILRVDPYRNLFSVTLSGIHSSGCKKSVTKKDLIRVLGPWPKFDIEPLSGCSPLTTTFTDRSQNVEKLYFDYQDNSPLDSGKITDHTYTIEDTSQYYQGFQPLIVAIAKDGCKASVKLEDTIKVFAKPTARFSAGLRKDCEPFRLNVKSYSSHATSHKWTLVSQHGSRGFTGKSLHRVLNAGKFDIGLRVENPAGCVDSIFKKEYIDVYKKPVAAFEPQDSIGCIGESFKFSDQTDSDVPVKKWRWDLEYASYADVTDSGFTQDFSPNLIFDGRLNVRLIVTNANGCGDTLLKHEAVNIYQGLPTESSQISWVGHLSNNEVTLEWEPSDKAYFRRFDLYRLGRSAQIGSWTTQETESHYVEDFLDTAAACFQLVMTDLCFDSHPSDTHCTVHLEVNEEDLTTADLNWTPYKGWDSVHSYAIYRSRGVGKYFKLATVPGNQLSYIDSSFCDSSYKYYIRAQNDQWNSKSNTGDFVPEFTFQDVPLEIGRATVLNNQTVQVNWEPSKQIGNLIYEISKKEEDGSWIYSWHSAMDTQIIDSNAKIHDFHYTYRVRVKDHCGNVGGNSNIGRSIVLEVDQTDQQVLLSWNSYQKWAEGVSHYIVQVKPPEADHFETIAEVIDTFFNDEEAFLSYESAYEYRIMAVERVFIPDTSVSNIRKVIPVPSIFAANAFSPNGDGRNDEFGIEGWALIEDSVQAESFNMRLFNRWGVKMFETNNIKQGWDGTFRGRNAPVDQYIWLARVTGLNGEIYFLRGGVLLMR